MAADPENVVTVTGGVAYIAPVGTVLPATAIATLNVAFKDFGYWANDGATTTPVPGDRIQITAHNGDPVIDRTKKGNITIQFPFIELNKTVFEVYWDTVVGVDGSYVIADGSANTEYALVYDRIFSDGSIDRQVAPRVNISDRAAVSSNESDPLTHDITFSTLKSVDYDDQLLGYAPRFVTVP